MYEYFYVNEVQFLKSDRMYEKQTDRKVNWIAFLRDSFYRYVGYFSM